MIEISITNSNLNECLFSEIERACMKTECANIDSHIESK